MIRPLRMTRPYPRVDKAQFSAVRLKVDARFIDIIRILEDSYYGTALSWDNQGLVITRTANGWKDKVSHSFVTGVNTYDVQITPAESKVLFDKLHGLVWQHYRIAMVNQNINDGSPYPTMDEDRSEEVTIF